MVSYLRIGRKENVVLVPRITSSWSENQISEDDTKEPSLVKSLILSLVLLLIHFASEAPVFALSSTLPLYCALPCPLPGESQSYLLYGAYTSAEILVVAN